MVGMYQSSKFLLLIGSLIFVPAVFAQEAEQPVPVDVGACCAADETACHDWMVKEECEGEGGTFYEGVTCAEEPCARAAGADVEQVSAEVTLADLEVEEPGLLPTSPFYFLKEWGRGLRRLVTFGSVRRAELEARITNQKAAELKKVAEDQPDNVTGIKRATANYQKNVERLKGVLERVKETSENPNVDRLLEKLTDRALKHQQLFDDLKAKHETLRASAEEAQKKVAEVLTKVPERFESAQKFSERLKRVVEKQRPTLLRELNAARVLDRVQENLPQGAASKVREVRENLLNKFESRIETEAVKVLPAVKERAVKLLEEMSRVVTCCVDGACTRVSEDNCGFAGGRVVDVNSCYPDPCGEAAPASADEVKRGEVKREVKRLQDLFFDIFVTIDEGGRFSPAAVEAKKGGKVTWTNRSQKPVWPASDIHPSHQLYPGLDALRGVKPGESYSFTFERIGSWGYHDHLNPSVTGVVRVVE